jgi:parallel beta-helix repeat protein
MLPSASDTTNPKRFMKMPHLLIKPHLVVCAFASLLIAGCLPGTSVHAKDVVFYVAPCSNGVWFGRSPNLSAGGKEGTAGSLQAVIEAVRAARRGLGPDAQATIFLRGGTYELAAPLVLTPEDSGLTVAAYRAEKPTISGGRRITGWRSVAGKPGWWETEIPAVRDGTWYFRSLFVKGRRAQRARTPSEGFFRIDGDSPQEHPAQLHFHPGDIEPEWALGGDVEVVALLAWADFRMFIRAVDETNHVAILSTNPRPSNREKNARYFIENAPDGLDAPGEWYLDRKTGVLTYIARAGEDLTKSEVIAPQLEELAVLRGDLAGKRPVEHVTLRGLTFSYTDWATPAEGYADTQAAVGVHGDIRAAGATDCVLQNCIFAHLANYAFELGRGCQRDEVSHCDMFDLGAGGIRLGEPDKRPDAFDQNHSHRITDNHIHQTGLIYPPAVGVFILQSGTNLVAHNEIDHLFYSAISVGWNWGYQETPCRENIIEFNHLHDIGQGMLSDMGAVYTLGIQKGTVIRHNLIRDVESFTYGGWGLYTDEGSSDILLENNVVYHCKSAGFHQHYGRENVIQNNIFALNREYQLMRTRNEEHISFLFTNNIVLFDSGQLLGGNWEGDHYVMDRNVYWDARPGAMPGAMPFSGATFENWRLRAHDPHSLIADPLFVAPGKLDFRLQTSSPALKLGFKPIALTGVGVRK